MSDVYAYERIVQQAKHVKASVEKEQKISGTRKWAYYFAKAIKNPNKPVKKIEFDLPKNGDGDYISRDIYKSSYTDMADRVSKYVEGNKKMPTNVKFTTKSGKVYRVGCDMYVYLFAKILAQNFPQPVNISSKVFIKPSETGDEVYNYFVRTFGKVTCIDDALEKIAGRGYGYYYDDVYSNKQSIDRIKNRLGVNCTDATQMMKHVADGTGKYKKVEGYHVKCRGGDGHIFLKITAKDGTVFYRDPAAVLDNGNIESVWCMNGTHLATNPSWWLANLNR